MHDPQQIDFEPLARVVVQSRNDMKLRRLGKTGHDSRHVQRAEDCVVLAYGVERGFHRDNIAIPCRA